MIWVVPKSRGFLKEGCRGYIGVCGVWGLGL